MIEVKLRSCGVLLSLMMMMTMMQVNKLRSSDIWAVMQVGGHGRSL